MAPGMPTAAACLMRNWWPSRSYIFTRSQIKQPNCCPLQAAHSALRAVRQTWSSGPRPLSAAKYGRLIEASHSVMAARLHFMATR